ncbi:MAG: glycosyltransferase [Deinococcales bacterium]
MNVAVVHNYYQQAGGEDAVFEAEADLLENKGHAVSRYAVHNDATRGMSAPALAVATIWNREQHRTLSALFRDFRPDVVHVHNTLPLISPAVYDAARRAGAAVVQTLHNYRLVCPSGLLFRNGRPCELCVGRSVPLPGVLHACYRASRPASGAVAAMLAFHRLRGSYRREVDRYIALTRFAKDTFVRGGLPPDKIAVKPNVVPADPGIGSGDGGYALFVGRLSEEKGVRVLLEAWRGLGGRPPLRVIGDGPLMKVASRSAGDAPGITLAGRLPAAEVREEMQRAAFLVVPSLWYEGFPMVVAEAYAAGTAVMASNIGALAEIVEHGRTGLTFGVGDSEDLARVASWLVEHPAELRAMRANARDAYERRYAAEPNYDSLMAIYQDALAARAG